MTIDWILILRMVLFPADVLDIAFAWEPSFL
jgi:hypothetical protein